MTIRQLYSATPAMITADDSPRALLSVAEPVTALGVAGVMGWTTTAANGSFGLGSDETVAAVTERWSQLQDELDTVGVVRLASAHQVHGNAVTVHGTGWTGWLRQRGIDGHITTVRGTALAVTVADCTPVFSAHEMGIALLHAGWRGAALGILKQGLEAMLRLGMDAADCSVHLGPSICAPCYEVGPEVLRAVTGLPATQKGHLDVRAALAEQAYALGVRSIESSRWCTRCGGRRFFSHRGGDAGRQLGVMALL